MTKVSSKGLVFDIKRFALHDGPGIRVTVFMKGCPLHCWWCHNPEGQCRSVEEIRVVNYLDGKAFEEMTQVGRWMAPGEVLHEILKDEMFMQESGGGVSFSGGEPLMQIAFLEETAGLCRKHGMHVTLDTTGYAPREYLERLLPHTDLFLYDIKHLDDEEHLNYTGVSNQIILENLEWLAGKGARIRLRFPLIPGINNGTEHIRELEKLVLRLGNLIDGLDILPYHKLGGHKYRSFGMEFRAVNIPEPAKEEVESLRARLTANTGLQVGIGG